MARKTGAEAAKAKAAKQKKIVILLAGVLVLALVYAFMTMRSLDGGGSQPVAATSPGQTTTTPAPAATAPATPVSSDAAPTLAGAPAPAASAATPVQTVPTKLVAVTSAPAGSGQLQSFSRFDSKDPFSSDGPGTTASSSSSSASTTTTAPAATTPAATTPTATTPAPQAAPAPPPTSAVLSVNGVAASVSVGTNFPVSTDPAQNGIFQLVGLTQKTAQVAVAGGSYATGQATLTLKVNKPVTLVNTADGKRYTLQLFPQGTAAPVPAAATTPPTIPGG